MLLTDRSCARLCRLFERGWVVLLLRSEQPSLEMIVAYQLAQGKFWQEGLPWAVADWTSGPLYYLVRFPSTRRYKLSPTFAPSRATELGTYRARGYLSITD